MVGPLAAVLSQRQRLGNWAALEASILRMAATGGSAVASRRRFLDRVAILESLVGGTKCQNFNFGPYSTFSDEGVDVLCGAALALPSSPAFTFKTAD